MPLLPIELLDRFRICKFGIEAFPIYNNPVEDILLFS